MTPALFAHLKASLSEDNFTKALELAQPTKTKQTTICPTGLVEEAGVCVAGPLILYTCDQANSQSNGPIFYCADDKTGDDCEQLINVPGNGSPPPHASSLHDAQVSAPLPPLPPPGDRRKQCRKP